MRAALLPSLLLCAAAQAQSPPPVIGLDADDTATIGGTAWVTVQLPWEAPPDGVEVRLVVGVGGVGAGPCPPQLLGECLDVRGPLALFGPYTSRSWQVQAEIPIDPSWSGTVGVQAVVLRPTRAFLSETDAIDLIAPGQLVDVAMTDVRSACSLDDVGVLRCHPTLPHDEGYLDEDFGPWVSLGGLDDQLCATAADHTMTCWTYRGPVTTTPLPAAAAQTFAQDDRESLMLPSADGTRMFAWLPDASVGLSGWVALPGSDLDIGPATYYGTRRYCVAEGTELACYEDDLPTAITNPDPWDFATTPTNELLRVGGGPWTDVGLRDTNYDVCGVRDDGVVKCFDATGTPTHGPYPARATTISGGGTHLFGHLASGAPYLVDGFDEGASDRVPDDAVEVSVIPLGMGSSASCWVTADGRGDCGGSILALNDTHAPQGDQWVDLHLAPSMALWVDDQGRTFDPAMFGAPDLSVADEVEAVSSGGALCGLDAAGTLQCTGGSHFLAVPPETYVAWDASDPYTESRPFCGVRASDGGLVCTSLDGLLEAVPAGVFTDVAVTTGTYWNPIGTHALAIDAAGTLHCWGDATSCANATVGLADVEVIRLTGGGAHALQSDGTLTSWTPGGAAPVTTASRTYDRYRAEWGIDASGTIGDWTDPGRPVAGGLFVDVVGEVYSVDAGVPDTYADACGLRANGSIRCWARDGATATPLPDLPGAYDRIASIAGALVARDAASGLTYTWSTLLPQTPVQVAKQSGFATCWLDTAGVLGCTGPGNYLDTYPVGQVYDRIEAQESQGLDFEGFCAFTASKTSCFGGGPYARSLYGTLGDLEATDITHWGGGAWCWVDRITGEAQCDGSVPPPFTPTQPPLSQTSLPSRDIAMNWGAGCRIRDDRELECWGSNYAYAPLPTGPFAQLEAANNMFVARRVDGTLAAFDTVTQTALAVPPGTFQAVDGLYTEWCGVRTDGTTECWSLGAGAIREQ